MDLAVIRERALADDPGILYTPVRVTTRDLDAPALLKLTKKVSGEDDAFFEEHQPFFWRSEISNSQVDAYSTSMAISTLKNFAAATKRGVAILLDHERTAVIGRSLTGYYYPTDGDILPRVESDAYTLRGMSPEADAAIIAVRGGIRSDTSVGFHKGFWRCSICGKDTYRWWKSGCYHIPGEEYPKLDDKGEPTGEKVVAIAYVEDAELSEYSLVYDGATPGASVLKAYRMAEAGKLPVEVGRALATRHRYLGPNWLGAVRVFPVPAIPEPAGKQGAQAPNSEEVRDMSQKTPDAIAPEVQALIDRAVEEAVTPLRTAADALTAATREALTRASAPATLPTDDPAKAIAWLSERVVELAPLADDGRAYRADLIDDALKQGVRALGEKFQEERYKRILGASSLEDIRQIRDDFKDAGDTRLKGGRLTTDREEPKQERGKDDAPVQLAAYR